MSRSAETSPNPTPLPKRSLNSRAFYFCTRTEQVSFYLSFSFHVQFTNKSVGSLWWSLKTTRHIAVQQALRSRAREEEKAREEICVYLWTRHSHHISWPHRNKLNMAENLMVDFIAKRIHHRISYAWKCCYNAHLSKTLSFLFPFLSFSLFFKIMPKKWVGRTTLNKEIKGGFPFNESIKV